MGEENPSKADIIPVVSFQVAGHQTEGYRVNTTVYEGPLDLLLELIERAEMDITVLAIAQVTDQYLDYLQKLEYRDPAEVSAFLVMAARLLQIKSAALLPRPPVIETTTDSAQDDAQALARQLILYTRFNEIAIRMGVRDANGLQTFLRVSPVEVKAEARADLSGLTLNDFLSATRSAFTNARMNNLEQVVTLPRVTIRDKIKYIIERLKSEPSFNFHEILHDTSRVEVVVTFLAMLELIKRRVLEARQENTFGEIHVDAMGEVEESPGEIELDFNE